MNIWSSLYLDLIVLSWKNHTEYFNELKNCFYNIFKIWGIFNLRVQAVHISMSRWVCERGRDVPSEFIPHRQRSIRYPFQSSATFGL